MRILAALMMVAALAACVPPTPSPAAGQKTLPIQREAAMSFLAVVHRVEPVAEAYCRSAGTAANCNFLIGIDDRPGQPANAFQTLDRSGRPVIAFTLALIAGARSVDELAFVLGHEAAHHIAGHIQRQQAAARTGAVLAGLMAEASGAGHGEVEQAQQVAAGLAARSYSKEFELQADAIGTEIAFRAGYDPLRGAAFFDRLPDPGDKFLGSHPANAQRKAQVVGVLASLRGY